MAKFSNIFLPMCLCATGSIHSLRVFEKPLKQSNFCAQNRPLPLLPLAQACPSQGDVQPRRRHWPVWA